MMRNKEAEGRSKFEKIWSNPSFILPGKKGISPHPPCHLESIQSPPTTIPTFPPTPNHVCGECVCASAQLGDRPAKVFCEISSSRRFCRTKNFCISCMKYKLSNTQKRKSCRTKTGKLTYHPIRRCERFVVPLRKFCHTNLQRQAAGASANGRRMAAVG